METLTREEFENKIKEMVEEYGAPHKEEIIDFLLETYHADRLAILWNKLSQEEKF